ncbi:MAG TPA: hypothetical protein VE988_21960 [Gemmataceae bacterium]|nr:hypothetical protein [Gemmataceae bacterium]
MNEANDLVATEMRRVLLATITAEDMAAVARALVEKAKSGNISAIRMVLSYVVGKPEAAKEQKAAAKVKPGVEVATNNNADTSAAAPADHVHKSGVLRPALARSNEACIAPLSVAGTGKESAATGNMEREACRERVLAKSA